MSNRLRAIVLLGVLVTAVFLFFNKMALTNLILARGDTLLYFYPYWQAAADALRAGRVPLWNPDLFMGAPFIANSQVGFFYPLNWPLWLLLPTPYAVSASILIHLLITAVGTYLAARRQLALDYAAAILAALLFALGGYLTAQVEHVNQLQGLAWLPWFFALWPTTAGQGWRYYLKSALPIALLFTLQLLAGHTQTVFITAVGFTTWLLAKSDWRFLTRFTKSPNHHQSPITNPPSAPLPLLLGVLFAILLSAVQLLPTLELTQHSSRQGGLPTNEVLSFSLHPLFAARALLPGYGQSLFSEYVAFLPLTALLLAFIAVWQWRKSAEIRPFLILAFLGLFLSLGRFNPLYYLLAHLPGFNLFRVPARWLALYGFGVALLAGYGWQLLRTSSAFSQEEWVKRVRRPLRFGTIVLLALMLWGFASVPLSRFIPLGPESPAEWPSLLTVSGWLVELTAVFIFISYRKRPINRAVPLLALTLVALFLASRTLPYNNLTTPEAYFDLRPSITRIQAATPPDGPKPRLLSLSNIFFDPGDLAEIRTIYDGILLEEAFYDYTIAIKQKEIIAPNLPLAYGLASLDGFDGGVLPLQNYTEVTTLLLPEGVETTDGRLRENLDAVPDARWLDLFGARFIITDKVGDTWREVASDQTAYFDLQLPQTLEPGQKTAVAYIPPFDATALFLIASGEAGTVEITTQSGQHDAILPQKVADDLFKVAFPGGSAVPESIELTAASAPWQISGLTLVNEADGTFQPLALGNYRLIHSGDVKIYENLDVLPRAFMVYEWLYRPSVSGGVSAMESADFDPSQQAVIVADGPERLLGQGEGQVEVLSYEPERIELSVNTSDSGLLVLTEANYPGWKAKINGQEVT
ncbi:MAG: hypothetical protein WAM60_24840, partial [Candidatus Promineifilaceae bacterium]